MPQLSIIVPVYNVESYIERCVNSLLNQSLDDLEIILVDDGSTDLSGKICDDYSMNYNNIRVIHQTNKGLSGARNSGISIAEGDYIGFVDSDDWVDKNYFFHLLNIIKENELDFVSGTYQHVNKTNQIKDVKTWSDKVSVLTRDEGFVFFLNSAIKGGTTHVACWTKIYKKSVLKGIFFEEGVIYEDIAFNWLVLSNTKRCAFVNVPGYYYFYNVESITNTLQKQFSISIYDYIHAAEKIKELYMNDNNKKSEIISLLDTFIVRTHFSVLIKMIKSKCNNMDLVINEIKQVKKNNKILLKSSLSIDRKIVLRFLCFMPTSLLVKAIYNS